MSNIIDSGTNNTIFDKNQPFFVFKSTNYNASAGEAIVADTSTSTFTITLPLSPTPGDQITIFDAANTFLAKPLIIARNNKNINGVADDLLMDEPVLKLIYINNSQGWRTL